MRYYGELAEMNTHLICSSILVGVLRPILTERVTLVNAVETAKERGISFVESTSTRQRSYSNLISVKLITNCGEEWVEGTVLHQNHLHLVSLYGIDVDAPLRGDMLIIRNADTPGVIGRVGTILGDQQINIANFALGRSETSPRSRGRGQRRFRDQRPGVAVDTRLAAGAASPGRPGLETLGTARLAGRPEFSFPLRKLTLVV